MKLTILTLFTGLSLLPNGLMAFQAPPKEKKVSALGLFEALSFRTVGPSRGGRVTAVAGHPSQLSTFYMGASGGGVWKTTDYGLTWHNISDGFFATGSIGAIRVARSDPSVLYVGTGSDGLRSNVIIGKGVYKSTNAGETWRHVGLGKTGNIGALLIHPKNPEIAYVAAIGNPFIANPERGVYRTKDGGATWEKIFFVSENTGACDLEFAPDNPDQIYATMWQAERKPWTIISGGHEGGVFKSSDGGDHWIPLTRGLPDGLRGKADLAVSEGDPKRVYVLIEAPGTKGGVYRSDNRGLKWRQVTDFEPIRTRPFYYTNLEAHPKNPDILWGMTEGFWKSTNAGVTWKRERVPHGDSHDMWINPNNPDIYVQSNDGGANVTVNAGKTWSTQFNQPTAELYQVDVSDEFPYRLYAGQQDNSTISVPSLPPRSMPGGQTALWESHGGCETGPVIPKPGEPHIVYANCKGRFGVYNRLTAQEQQYYVGFADLYGQNPKDLTYRFQRVAPVHVSPHNPNRVYHGSQYVHVTEDYGKTWTRISDDLTAFTPETQVISGAPITVDSTGEEHFSTLYEIQESPHEPGVIWVGANDGPIHFTRDGGKNWVNVTPEQVGPYGRVQTIEVSPHNPAAAYVSILRYQLGDFEPYVFKTENYGGSWTRITTGDNGIPRDHPVRVVREDPDRKGLLYAGTEFGLFISFDDGKKWQSFQRNLPVTPVTDIKVVYKDLVLSTMGRGFWIMDNLTPLHELPEKGFTSGAHLFKIRDAYRFNGRRLRGRSPSDPRYPPVGVNIDYHLASVPEGEVRLDIQDAQGTVIRTFTSAKKKKGTLSQASSPEPGLLKQEGLFRFTWNLRHTGLEGTDPGKKPEGMHGPQEPVAEAPAKPKKKARRQKPLKISEGSGPMVSPGTYTARLSVGDWRESQTFGVKLDPRALAEGITKAEVIAQTEMALEVRDKINEVRRTYEKAESQLAEIRKQLVAKPERYSEPKLINQLKYLYFNIFGADQAPGQDAQARFKELIQSLEIPLQQLEKLNQALDNEVANGEKP